MPVTVIIPTLNGAERIGNCLAALASQLPAQFFEVLVVDDGSTDTTAEVVGRYLDVRLIKQSNAGPAAARNLGALHAQGELLAFTDDDCVPTSGWLQAMLAPFDEDGVVGVKGTYRTRQRSLAARFVQLEYEDKYRLMSTSRDIDFVDTYSAAFRRDRFVEMRGYDTSFPVACAEDVELSYRMAARGWRMRFAPTAIVFHTHPDTFAKYLRKKYKFAYWRVLAVRKNPGKGIKDSHTPQIMKLQLLLAPALLLAAASDLLRRPAVPLSVVVLALFAFSTLPFALRSFRKDALVGLLSPALLAARAVAQFLGVAGGLLYAWRSARQPSGSVPAPGPS